MQLTFYHGTSERGLREIKKSRALKAPKVADVIREVSEHFGVPLDVIRRRGRFEFSRGRVGDPYVYFTTIKKTGRAYAMTRGEIIFDAIMASLDAKGGSPDEKRKRRNAAGVLEGMLGAPVLLTLRTDVLNLVKLSPDFDWWDGPHRVEIIEKKWWPQTFRVTSPVPANWIIDSEFI